MTTENFQAGSVCGLGSHSARPTARSRRLQVRRTRPTRTYLDEAACTADLFVPGRIVVVSRKLRLELGDLRLDSCLVLVLALLDQALPRLLLSLPLGLLRGGDLGFHILHVPSKHRTRTRGHHRVDDFVVARLPQLCKERVVASTHGLRERCQDRVGVFFVVKVEQRADDDAGRPSDQDTERAAEDADQQPDDPAARGRNPSFFGPPRVLLDHTTACITPHHRRLAKVDLLFGVELLQSCERRECLIVLVEIHSEHVGLVEVYGIHSSHLPLRVRGG